MLIRTSHDNYGWTGQVNSEDDDNDDHLTVDEMVVVERPILTEFDFEQGFEKTEKPARTPLTWARKKAGKCVCSCSCLKSFLVQVFPFLRILRGYSLRSDLPSDIVAGLTVGIMHIPQGRWSLNSKQLRWLSGKASASRVAHLGSKPCFSFGAFSRLSHTSDWKIVLMWLPCKIPGMLGPVLSLGSMQGLVGLMSVYID